MKNGFKFMVFSFAALLFTACSNIMGYSLLLWGVPERGLQDGEIVPVYIKSNISHTYVIGLPESEEKFEVPLWQITEPTSKRKIKDVSARYADYFHQYAHVKLDGLPIRSEPVNISKQLYRLRKNESVKLLYKGTGQPVMVGQNALEGDWLMVMTQDGTTGWCFSYNLQQYETDAAGNILGGQVEEIQAEDDVLKNMLSKRWYPDAYTAMIRDRRIDLDKMNASYGFETGAESGIVSLTMEEIAETWNYNGVTKIAENIYKYNDIPIEVTVRSGNFIVVRYTGESGKPQDFNLAPITEDIPALIAEEIARREEELATLKGNSGRFRSSNYGQLTFNSDNTFTWRGYSLLVPSLIVRNAGNDGTISIKYFIANSLKSNYDGILTFKFDKMNKELNFLYKLEDGGLRLTDAGGATFRNVTVQSVNQSPLVLFFARQ